VGLLVAIVLLCIYPNQPGVPLPDEVKFFLGLILLSFGLALETRGSMDLGVKRSVGGVCGDELIVKGIYRTIRHPQNLGGMIWILGVALLANSSYLLLAHLFLWCPLLVVESYIEDMDLKRKFGREFERYAREVPMFFPRARVRANIINNFNIN